MGVPFCYVKSSFRGVELCYLRNSFIMTALEVFKMDKMLIKSIFFKYFVKITSFSLFIFDFDS